MGSVATLRGLRSRRTLPRAAQETGRATRCRASRRVLRGKFHAALERVNAGMEPGIAGCRYTSPNRQKAEIRAAIGVRSARLAWSTTQADVLNLVAVTRAAAARMGAACRPCAHAAAASRMKAYLPTALTRLAAPLRPMVPDALPAARRPAHRCCTPRTIRPGPTRRGIGFVTRTRPATTRHADAPDPNGNGHQQEPQARCRHPLWILAVDVRGATDARQVVSTMSTLVSADASLQQRRTRLQQVATRPRPVVDDARSRRPRQNRSTSHCPIGA